MKVGDARVAGVTVLAELPRNERRLARTAPIDAERPSPRVVVSLPNGLTLFNLFFGIYAIVAGDRAATSTRRRAFIVLGGIADTLDGRVARATGTGSRFGEELDSLVDAISFGLAPALIMYFAVLEPAAAGSGCFVFIFTACAVMRLARFNVEQAGRKKTHFHGLPSPAAGLTLATYYWFSQTPLYNQTIILFTDSKTLADLPWHTMLRGLMAVLAALMISDVPYPTVPSIGFKSIRGRSSARSSSSARVVCSCSGARSSSSRRCSPTCSTASSSGSCSASSVARSTPRRDLLARGAGVGDGRARRGRDEHDCDAVEAPPPQPSRAQLGAEVLAREDAIDDERVRRPATTTVRPDDDVAADGRPRVASDAAGSRPRGNRPHGSNPARSTHFPTRRQIRRMNRYRIAVHIIPRRGILDPQGKTVADALHTLGFAAVRDVHVGRHIVVEIDAGDRARPPSSRRARCASGCSPIRSPKTSRSRAWRAADMKFGIVTFPGSNCDYDAYQAVVEQLGEEAVYLWHKDHDLKQSDVIILPGGFSYGDYLRAGAIARFSPIMQDVIAHRQARRPGARRSATASRSPARRACCPGALLRNASLKYICECVRLRVENDRHAVHEPLRGGRDPARFPSRMVTGVTPRTRRRSIDSKAMAAWSSATPAAPPTPTSAGARTARCAPSPASSTRPATCSA